MMYGQHLVMSALHLHMLYASTCAALSRDLSSRTMKCTDVDKGIKSLSDILKAGFACLTQSQEVLFSAEFGLALLCAPQ